MMKKVCYSFVYLLLFCSVVFSQEKSKGIGGGVGTNFLIGDSPIVDSKISPNFGLYAIYGLNKRIDLKFQIGVGKFGVNSVGKVFSTSFMPVELQGLYSIFPNSKFNPFVQAGIGAFRFSVNGAPNYYDGMVIGGLGFKYAFNPTWTWLVSANLRYTTGDDFNGHSGGMKDGYFNLQYGLTYNLNKQKKYEKKELKNDKDILVQHYIQEQNILLKTQLENIRVEIEKLDQELSYLNKMVEVHLNNIQNFTAQLYQFALNSGQEEKVRFLAVSDKVIQ